MRTKPPTPRPQASVAGVVALIPTTSRRSSWLLDNMIKGKATPNRYIDDATKELETEEWTRRTSDGDFRGGIEYFLGS